MKKIIVILALFFLAINAFASTMTEVISFKDPEFIDEVNEDDQDADGSRLSIGYYPHEEQDRWEFVDEDIVWMSFPKLPCADGENNGDMVLAKDILGRFEETTTPDIQLWQENKIENTASFTGIYDENSFIYDWSSEIYSFNSTDGLKIKIEDNFYSLNPLITGGLLCEPDTPVTVTTEAGDLNWVGYFLPQTKLIWNAIDTSTLNKLSMIKTHNWTIYRDKQGNWVGGVPPEGLTLKYGDMAELYPKSDQSNFTFCWQMFGSTAEDYSRQETQYFSYEEELDYQSIFVELGETHPDEIAVYVDGECRGAEVVDVDSLLEIRAYILSEPQGQEIEIVTASGRAGNTSANYQVLDDNNKLVNRKLFTDSGKKYQRISLNKAEEVPEPLDIISCYPNPFNPQLTISYTLAESIDNLEIHIYNAKGQKVRTMKNTVLTSGTNSVIWNGDNDSGELVSSGVYFINMQINDKLYTKKAVLMK